MRAGTGMFGGTPAQMRLLRDGMQGTLHQNLELAALMQSALQHSSDFREAVAAIFEKRPPLFQGQ